MKLIEKIAAYFSLSITIVFITCFLAFIGFFSFGILLPLIFIIPVLLRRRFERKYYIEVKRSWPLFKLVKKLSEKHGTRIDKVFLTPNVDVSVSGVLKKRLYIGLAGVLQLNEKEFYVILCHEFGHFKGRDTFFSAFVGSIFYSLSLFLEYFYWIAWTFYGFFIWYSLYFFRFLLLLLSLPYMRYREKRADMFAAKNVGGEFFAKTLLKYSIHCEDFSLFSFYSTRDLIRKGLIWKNIYSSYLTFYKKADKKRLEELKRKILSAKRKLLETHPPIRERIEAVRGIKGKRIPATRRKLIKLIPNFEEICEKLTQRYLELTFRIKVKKRK